MAAMLRFVDLCDDVLHVLVTHCECAVRAKLRCVSKVFGLLVDWTDSDIRLNIQYPEVVSALTPRLPPDTANNPQLLAWQYSKLGDLLYMVVRANEFLLYLWVCRVENLEPVELFAHNIVSTMHYKADSPRVGIQLDIRSECTYVYVNIVHDDPPCGTVAVYKYTPDVRALTAGPTITNNRYSFSASAIIYNAKHQAWRYEYLIMCHTTTLLRTYKECILHFTCIPEYRDNRRTALWPIFGEAGLAMLYVHAFALGHYFFLVDSEGDQDTVPEQWFLSYRQLPQTAQIIMDERCTIWRHTATKRLYLAIGSTVYQLDKQERCVRVL